MANKNTGVIRGCCICIIFLLTNIINPAFSEEILTHQTIAHNFLDLEKSFGANTGHYKIIDKIINKAKSNILIKNDYTTEEAVNILKSIYDLLKEEDFVFKENFLISTGLEQKKIDCDTYSALYTAISEILKLPMIPVNAPGHSFVRFNFKDGSYLNWDPVEGNSLPDAFYIKKLNISKESIEKGVYLKSLSRKEFMGVEYNNIGAYLISKNRFQDAIPYLDMSINLYPNYSSAWHNRGSAYYAIKMLNKALPDLIQANSLDPMRANTHNTLGDIYFDRNEYNNALDHYTESVRLDPEYYPPFHSIGLLLQIAGKDNDAKFWFKKSEELKKKHGK